MVMRKLGYLVPAVLVLVILLGPTPRPSLAFSRHPMDKSVQSAKVPAVASVLIHLNGFVGAWNQSANPNPTITVTKDDTVTVSLVSSDSIPHRFLLDMDRDGAADTADCATIDPCSVTFPPNTSFSFTAGATGTYTYYCTIHPTTMIASFVIQAARVAGGGGGRPPLAK
jgi:hypothetical protein